jgi:hypothetical protein
MSGSDELLLRASQLSFLLLVIDLSPVIVEVA